MSVGDWLFLGLPALPGGVNALFCDGSEAARLAVLFVSGVMVVVCGLVRRRSQRRELQEYEQRVLNVRELVRRSRGDVGEDADPIVRGRLVPDLIGSIRTLERESADVLGRFQKDVSLLSQNTTLLEGVLGTMQEGVLVLDTRERLVYANLAGRLLLNISSDGRVGRLAWEFIRWAPLQDLVAKLLSTRQTQREELSLPKRKRVIETTTALLNLDGEDGILIVFDDVTDLRRLESVRRDFVSNVSHELKTPLTCIQAYADTLLDGGLEDEDARRGFVVEIQQQAERLRLLIMDVLRLASVESHAEAFSIQPVSALDLMEQCLADHRPVAEKAGLKLLGGKTGDEGPSLVLADPEGLRTILNNLVGNAIAYTPAGGQVTVRFQESAGIGILEVEDTGVGIAREHHARIFERFYRADKARARHVGGTGLGLAIVKHLVQLFHGDVTVDSELGKGTRFSVSLPLADD